MWCPSQFFPSSDLNQASASGRTWSVIFQTKRDPFLFFKISREELSRTFINVSTAFTSLGRQLFSLHNPNPWAVTEVTLFCTRRGGKPGICTYLRVMPWPAPFQAKQSWPLPPRSHSPPLSAFSVRSWTHSKPSLSLLNYKTQNWARKGVCWVKDFPSQFLQIPERLYRLVKWISFYRITRGDSGMTALGEEIEESKIPSLQV